MAFLALPFYGANAWGIALYKNEVFKSGSCMSHVSDREVGKVLNRNGVSYVGSPSAGELKSLATGLRQIERLLGGALPPSWRPKLRYVKAGGTWNYGLSKAGFITVKQHAPHGGGTNIGRLMHEYGHKIGNLGYYSKFSNFPGANRCNISAYAAESRNERFAESFEAFIVHPQHLKQKCPATYRFFETQMFPKASNSKNLALCGKSAKQRSRSKSNPQRKSNGTQ